MADYFGGRSWADITREERLFCAVLFAYARQQPDKFAKWVIETAPVPTDPAGSWELAYEACFYRDLLHSQGRSARGEHFPYKRTFDLCLFGDNAIIVIEAKVCAPFDGEQNGWFRKDPDLIREATCRPDLDVYVVPLAAGPYYSKCRKSTLSEFTGQLTWAQIAARYPDPLLARADTMYGDLAQNLPNKRFEPTAQAPYHAKDA